ncbi:glutaredoxin family protein [Gilvibacter sediminis]|uniref:glutaredoxin family protein n=1 Tax=Gilvibacter sediminis TaxID=379071 RepID=UPI0023508696|nr:glutaredoxin domain-containing protein [Gilvibacter sediminis]MDC7999375.1 glutaredoxin domain-containing protein [Gilvibacter sediminis]
MPVNKLKLYGTQWCLKTAQLRQFLQAGAISFLDLDVEKDGEAAADLRRLFSGNLKFPTITYGGQFLKNPSITVLEEFLEKHHLKD